MPAEPAERAAGAAARRARVLSGLGAQPRRLAIMLAIPLGSSLALDAAFERAGF